MKINSLIVWKINIRRICVIQLDPCYSCFWCGMDGVILKMRFQLHSIASPPLLAAFAALLLKSVGLKLKIPINSNAPYIWEYREVTLISVQLDSRVGVKFRIDFHRIFDHEIILSRGHSINFVNHHRRHLTLFNSNHFGIQSFWKSIIWESFWIPIILESF